MSNDKNIENFDSFFKDAFNSFEPTPPKGVFEAIQSQVGVAGGSGTAAGATTAAKVGAWGVGKIIVGAVAVIAVATTVYVATPSKGDINKTPTVNEVGIAENKAITAQQTLKENANNSNNNVVGENDKEDAKGSEQNNSSNASKPTNGDLTITDVQEENGTSAPENKAGLDITPQTNTPKDKNNEQKDAPQNSKAIVGIYLSDKQLCANERLTVTIADDLSLNKYKVYFGDGTSTITQLGKPTTHNYTQGGKYKVVAIALNGKKETVEQWVVVKNTKAQFEAVSAGNATFKFINKSINGVHYTWFFGDETPISQEENPTHTYKNFKPKSYKVKLIAVDNIGCVDSFSTYLKQNYTYEDKKPKMYNVFSPGVDGKNDHFEIEINDEEKYHLMIFDKNGEKVFESRDKNIMWDGRNMNTGNNCPAANYVVMFSYKIKGFEEQQEKKFLALVR